MLPPWMDVAVGHLRQLTTLYLALDDPERVPPAITRLRRLQHLGIETDDQVDANLRLPHGEWVTSLRCLGLPWATLQAAVNAGRLAGAVQLELLCSTSLPTTFSQSGWQWTTFWHFVATHPSLRCLAVQPSNRQEGSCKLWQGLPLLDSMLQLQRRRTTLDVLRTSSNSDQSPIFKMLADASLQFPRV